MDIDYLREIAEINGKLKVIDELLEKLQADKTKLIEQYARAKAKHGV